MKELLILSVTFLLLLPFVASQEVTRDVELSFTVSDVQFNETYTNFLRLENLDHTTGISDNLEVNVTIILQTLNDTKINRSVVRTLNKYTESGMGSLLIEENKTHELCASFTPLNFVDLNSSNNEFCVNISFQPVNITNTTKDNTTVEDTIDPCNCELNVTAPRIINSSETLPININWCVKEGSYTQNVSYWIEDMQGSTIKSNVTTTSPIAKQYTPKISVIDKTFEIKANAPQCNKSAYTLFTVVNSKIKPQKKSEIKLDANTENNKVSLRLAGFKNDTNREVINVYLEQENERVTKLYKYYVREKNTGFDIESLLEFEVETGIYNLVAKGFEAEDSITIDIETIPSENTCNPTNYITSFYTRQKLFAQNINVFFNVKNTANQVLLHTSSKSIDVTGLDKYAVNITNEREVLLLEARKEENSDFGILRLDLEKTTTNQPVEVKEKVKVTTTETTNTSKNDSNEEEINITFLPSQNNSNDYNYSYFFIGFASLLLFYKEIRKLAIKIWIKYLNKPKL